MLRLLVNLALVAVALGQTSLPYPIQWDSKIVGGEETTIEEYPYQVSVLYIFRHICGGSIINENTVLTAAHCTDGRRPFTMQVRAGTTFKDDYKEPSKLYNVDKIYQHPHFTMHTIDSDISILKLKQSIIYSNTIQPIPLQSYGIDVPDNQFVTVTGWGATQEGTHSVNNLRKVILTIVPQSQCVADYGSRITQNMFCAQAPGKDACQGDSGGPVVYNGHLVGIVSWGIGCARPDFPGVFTRISTLRYWIDENMI